MNPLEILHIKLGHAPEQVIKRICKLKMLKGLHYTYDDIKNLPLGLCSSCMKGRMKAFPIPYSISNKTYGIFEYLTVDIIYNNKRSCRGYRYIALFVDKAN
jgi:hypothetical protein